MKKPWWVRAIGILGWVCVALLGLSFFMWFTGGQNPAFAGAGIVLSFLAVGFFVLWAVISFVLYAIRSGVKQQAAIQRDVMHDAIKHLGPQAVKQPPAARSDVWDNPATKIRCDGCGRFHAMLFCRVHNQYLCFPCLAKHDTEFCDYRAAGRMVDDAHKQPAAAPAVGSVLFR